MALWYTSWALGVMIIELECILYLDFAMNRIVNGFLEVWVNKEALVTNLQGMRLRVTFIPIRDANIWGLESWWLSFQAKSYFFMNRLFWVWEVGSSFAHLVGEALVWFKWAVSRRPIMNWVELKPLFLKWFNLFKRVPINEPNIWIYPYFLFY